MTAVANGDLKQNLTVKSMGEVAALAETINNMTDTLAIFADQGARGQRQNPRVRIQRGPAQGDRERNSGQD